MLQAFNRDSQGVAIVHRLWVQYVVIALHILNAKRHANGAQQIGVIDAIGFLLHARVDGGGNGIRQIGDAQQIIQVWACGV